MGAILFVPLNTKYLNKYWASRKKIKRIQKNRPVYNIIVKKEAVFKKDITKKPFKS